MGAMVTEGLAAADRLTALGHPADVVVVTSPGLLFRAPQSRRGPDGVAGSAIDDAVLGAVFPPSRATPMVTVLDPHPHTLAFLAGVHRVPAAHLGVTRFGQSGNLASVYRHHEIDADAVVGAALDLLD